MSSTFKLFFVKFAIRSKKPFDICTLCDIIVYITVKGAEMKRKNYSFNLAKSVTTSILLPLFAVLDIVIIVVLSDCFDSIWEAILLPTATIAAVGGLGFLALFIAGNAMYKRHSFSQDEQWFYGGKRKLKKSNLKRIFVGKLDSVFMVEFLPIKDGVIKTCKLLYYFYSRKELIDFLFENDLMQYLEQDEKDLLQQWQAEMEETHCDDIAERFPCPCCGNLTYPQKPGFTSYHICPVCFWEDDPYALFNPFDADNVNRVSLAEARENYLEFKACSKEFVEYVRPPKDDELESPNNDEREILS